VAELRTEINDLAARVEQINLMFQREHLALKTMTEALKTRATDEIAAQVDHDKLAQLETKIAAFELEGSKPKAATHAKSHSS
jgi:hypothetical protein